MKSLKKFIKLMIESSMTGPFETLDSMDRPKSSNFRIIRKFPWAVTPEQIQVMGLQSDDLSNGTFDVDHEIDIDVDVRFRHSKFKGDADDFDVVNWLPVSIDGFDLTFNDGQRLQDYLGGELTKEERDTLEEQERLRPPSYDEPDDLAN